MVLGRWLTRLTLLLGLLALSPAQAVGEPLRAAEACPTDPEPLMAGLLRDLPGYANRVVSQVQGLSAQPLQPVTTVLVASAPDFTPLDLSAQAFGAGLLDQTSDIQQVFFTTLERQFWPDRIVALQNFHWLFLVRTEAGWRMALLYSSLGPYGESDRPPTPPQESSTGVIGQAVSLWLRDCRAGAVLPPVAPTGP